VSLAGIYLAVASQMRTVSIIDLYQDQGGFDRETVKTVGRVWYASVQTSDRWRDGMFPEVPESYTWYFILEDVDPVARAPRRLHVWTQFPTNFLRNQVISVSGQVCYVVIDDEMQPYLIADNALQV